MKKIMTTVLLSCALIFATNMVMACENCDCGCKKGEKCNCKKYCNCNCGCQKSKFLKLFKKKKCNCK